MIDTFTEYMQYPFVQHAMIAGLLIAAVSALVGLVLLPRGLAFLGDGTSHVSFLAAVASSLLGIGTGSYLLSVPAAMVITLILMKIKDRSGTVLAAVSSGTLGLGYLLVNLFGKSANISGDVCGMLFGATNILTITDAALIECIVMTVAISVMFIVFYRNIRTYVADRAYFRTAVRGSTAFEYALSACIAAVIAFASSLVGALLATSLIIFPVLGASRLTGSYRAFAITSVAISVTGVFIGLALSIVYGTPVGATIIAVDAAVCIICALIGLVIRRSC